MRHILLVFLLIAPGLWAAEEASPAARQHMEAGLRAAQQHQLETAVTEFKKVTELAPELPSGFVRLGQVYMEGGQFEAAMAPLKHALELAPDLPPAHRLLGYALLAQGYAKDAIPHFAAIQDNAGMGIAQLEANQASEAVTNLQIALKSKPGDADLLFYLSRASAMLSSQTSDALLTLYPNSARAHQQSGKELFNMRQMPDAEKEYLQAIAIRPDLPDIHLELGQIYAASSQWVKAEQEFRTEAARQPGNAEVAYRLGDALLQQGKSQEAKQELERSNKLRPDMSETLYALGKADSACGDSGGAEKAWVRVVDLEKESPLAGQAHFGLAGLYRKERKFQQAEKEMQAFRDSRKQGGDAEKGTQQ